MRLTCILGVLRGQEERSLGKSFKVKVNPPPPFCRSVYFSWLHGCGERSCEDRSQGLPFLFSHLSRRVQGSKSQKLDIFCPEHCCLGAYDSLALKE